MSDLLSDFLSFVIILAEAISAVTLFDTLMQRKKVLWNNNITLAIETLLLSIIILFIVKICPSQLLRGIIIILAYYFVTVIFYKSNLIMGLGISITFYATLLFVDYFMLIAISSLLSQPMDSFFNEHEPTQFFIATTISKTMLLLIIITFKKLLYRKGDSLKFEYISKYHWLVYILQSLISMLALLSIIYLSFSTSAIPFIAIAASIGLLFLNIAVFWLLESASRLGRNIRENALIKQQIEIELDSVKSLSQAFDTQRQFVHDYKNELDIIYQLLKTKEYQQAVDLVKSLSRDIYYALYRIKTSHSIIDAILNQKDLQAKRAGITLDIKASDLSMIIVPDELLITIIANALDNAIEACQDISTEKVISVKAVVENNIFILSVINPVNKHVEIFNNTIQTTKSDKTIHGIGFKNISTALSKCNGDYELDCNEQRFQFTAFIRLTI